MGEKDADYVRSETGFDRVTDHRLWDAVISNHADDDVARPGPPAPQVPDHDRAAVVPPNSASTADPAAGRGTQSDVDGAVIIGGSAEENDQSGGVVDATTGETPTVINTQDNDATVGTAPVAGTANAVAAEHQETAPPAGSTVAEEDTTTTAHIKATAEPEQIKISGGGTHHDQDVARAEEGVVGHHAQHGAANGALPNHEEDTDHQTAGGHDAAQTEVAETHTTNDEDTDQAAGGHAGGAANHNNALTLAAVGGGVAVGGTVGTLGVAAALHHHARKSKKAGEKRDTKTGDKGEKKASGGNGKKNDEHGRGNSVSHNSGNSVSHNSGNSMSGSSHFGTKSSWSSSEKRPKSDNKSSPKGGANPKNDRQTPGKKSGGGTTGRSGGDTIASSRSSPRSRTDKGRAPVQNRPAEKNGKPKGSENNRGRSDRKNSNSQRNKNYA